MYIYGLVKVWDVASNSMGSHVSSVSADGVVNLWRLDTHKGSLVGSFTLASHGFKGGRHEETTSGFFDDIYSVAWHPDGRHLITGGHDRRVQILDIGRDMSVLKSLSGHDAAVVEVSEGGIHRVLLQH